MVTTKKCSCRTCDTTIPGYLLMCQRHWMMVPSGVRVEVQNAYREGREMKIHPTQRYLDARTTAIRIVNDKVSAAAASAPVHQPSLQLT